MKQLTPKRLIIIGTIVFVFVVLGLVSWWVPEFNILNSGAKFKKPNILVISLCSWRKGHLHSYGYQRNTMPHVEEFAQGAYIFDNVFASVPWAAPHHYFSDIPASTFDTYGYQAIGTKATLSGSKPEAANVLLWLGTDDLKMAFKKIRKQLKQPHKKPFFLNVHIMFPHFPYFHFPTMQDIAPYGEGRFITEGSHQRLSYFISHPQELLSRLPLALAAFKGWPGIGESELVQAHLRHKEIGRPYGLIYNEQLLEKWQSLPGLEQDRQLLIDAYDSKLSELDGHLRKLFRFFGNRRLANSTVVILLGDHGTSLLEHGSLHTKEAVYDEVAELPMFVKFPDELDSSIRIPGQFEQADLRSIVLELMAGNLTAENFDQVVQASLVKEQITIRNCTGTKYAIRAQNKYKYIYDFASEERELYLLETDPGELNNVVASHPDLAAELEDKLLDSFDDAVKFKSKTTCVPD